MYKGAVFFDMDGTLIDSKNGIKVPTQTTKEAIERLKANHYLTVLATGRSRCYIPKEFHLFDGYVTSNGAYAAASGEVIFNYTIPREDLVRLAAYLDEIGINYVVEAQDKCFVKDIHEHYYKRMMRRFNFPEDSFYPLEDIRCMDFNKLMVSYDSMEKIQRFMQDYKDKYYITGHTVNQSSDVSKIGITKGCGVGKIIEHFKIPLENTYAFGDADNDIEMFKSVGTGIAMGEHTENLEKVSSIVTETVENEGIFKALVKLNLI